MMGDPIQKSTSRTTKKKQPPNAAGFAIPAQDEGYEGVPPAPTRRSQPGRGRGSSTQKLTKQAVQNHEGNDILFSTAGLQHTHTSPSKPWMLLSVQRSSAAPTSPHAARPDTTAGPRSPSPAPPPSLPLQLSRGSPYRRGAGGGGDVDLDDHAGSRGGGGMRSRVGGCVCGQHGGVRRDAGWS